MCRDISLFRSFFYGLNSLFQLFGVIILGGIAEGRRTVEKRRCEEQKKEKMFHGAFLLMDRVFQL